MTERLFWIDPYRTSLDTRIASVNECVVTLDSTIFYASAGGQESDHGTIAGYPVSEAKLAGDTLEYSLPQGHGLRTGDPVTVTIDWNRRYRLMRLHFAAELVLQLAYRAMPDARRIGAHIAEDKARLDFEWQESVGRLLPLLEDQVRSIIDADLAIESGFSDDTQERRFWRTAGFDAVPCCGTHLKRTGEIGEIRLKRSNPGRGKERIEIRLAG